MGSEGCAATHQPGLPGQAQHYVLAVLLQGHPQVQATPKGTGDLFSAMLTGYLLQGVPLMEAARQACEHVAAVLESTRERGWAELALFSGVPLRAALIQSLWRRAVVAARFSAR